MGVRDAGGGADHGGRGGVGTGAHGRLDLLGDPLRRLGGTGGMLYVLRVTLTKNTVRMIEMNC